LESSNFISQSVQTDADGAFRFNQLEAGPYTILVEGEMNLKLPLNKWRSIEKRATAAELSCADISEVETRLCRSCGRHRCLPQRSEAEKAGNKKKP
jgi:hypothetical protein